MIRWLVIGAGYAVIWLVTVPRLAPYRHREVAMLALPAGYSHNPAKKGQETVVVEGKLGLVPWESYTTRRGMNTQLTRKVNYTFPTIPSKLLPWVDLRRKKTKIQKTKKVLRQCGR